ncbi:MAG: uncharacterized protein KVP18_002208 [Porospora cf. gigantea A]|uniref:uncharacterized protein n=1 Tax=Porospora cf. gigantea A TaxID=2853593 RepID=UPI00355ABC53|nr:MAG: hypothetical protein KVP18_002208 [Porospora cf. gigantea A]
MFRQKRGKAGLESLAESARALLSGRSAVSTPAARPVKNIKKSKPKCIPKVQGKKHVGNLWSAPGFCMFSPTLQAVEESTTPSSFVASLGSEPTSLKGMTNEEMAPYKAALAQNWNAKYDELARKRTVEYQLTAAARMALIAPSLAGCIRRDCCLLVPKNKLKERVLASFCSYCGVFRIPSQNCDVRIVQGLDALPFTSAAAAKRFTAKIAVGDTDKLIVSHCRRCHNPTIIT